MLSKVFLVFSLILRVITTLVYRYRIVVLSFSVGTIVFYNRQLIALFTRVFDYD